jgi:hypothetical protein
MADHSGVLQPSAVRSGEPRGPVRQKVAVACDECRSRKSKCDGIKPSESSSVAWLKKASGRYQATPSRGLMMKRTSDHHLPN